MEGNAKAKKDKGKSVHPSGSDEQLSRGDSIQAYKKIWRRVINKRLGCYEIYIGESNYLVATGIYEKSDSFLIGAIPVIMKLLENFCDETKKGVIEKETYEEARDIIARWRDQQSFAVRTGLRKPTVKGEEVDRIDLRKLNSPECKLEQKGGGSYQHDGCFPE